MKRDLTVAQLQTWRQEDITPLAMTQMTHGDPHLKRRGLGQVVHRMARPEVMRELPMAASESWVNPSISRRFECSECVSGNVVNCREMSVSQGTVLEQIRGAEIGRCIATGCPRVAGVLARRVFRSQEHGVRARRLHGELYLQAKVEMLLKVPKCSIWAERHR